MQPPTLRGLLQYSAQKWGECMTKNETQAVRMARMEEHIVKLAEHLERNGEAAERVAGEVREVAGLLRGDIASIRTDIATIKERHAELEGNFDKLKATARGIGIGWAAAFTFIGGAIATGFSHLVEAFK